MSNLAANINSGSTLVVSAPISETTPGRTLTVGGGGVLQLDGANTFTGMATVQGATLSGTGSLAGPLTIAAGGHLAPGDNTSGNFGAFGSMTVGALTSATVRRWITTSAACIRTR